MTLVSCLLPLARRKCPKENTGLNQWKCDKYSRDLLLSCFFFVNNKDRLYIYIGNFDSKFEFVTIFHVLDVFAAVLIDWFEKAFFKLAFISLQNLIYFVSL